MEIIGFILLVVAWLLILPLSLVNWVIVLYNGNVKGYFLSTSRSLDVWANREFRSLWNATLRKQGGYDFGKINETISSALGKNIQLHSLTITGKALVWLLDKFEEDHCIKAIQKL